MNKMKNILLGVVTITSVLLASCNRKDFVEPEFVPKSFNLYSYNDLFYPNWDLNTITIGSDHAIADLSMGYLKHTWSFMKESEVGTDLADGEWEEAGDNIRFFTVDNGTPPTTLDDDEDPVIAYEPYYDYSKSCITSDLIRGFLYTTAGRYKINIQNIYDEQISYKYTIGDDLVTSDYVVQKYATPMGDGNYEVNIDFEILVYLTLAGTSTVYSDSEYMTQMDLESLNTYDTGEGVMSVPVKAGTTLYLLEDGGDTPWDGSSSCSWGATYVSGSDSSKTLPTIVYSEKGDKDYTRSRAAYTFDVVGSTYQITMSHYRDAYKPEYNTVGSGLGTTKTNNNSAGYLFTVVE